MRSNEVACTPLYSHKAHRDICANNSKLGEELFTIKGKSTRILSLQKGLVKARSCNVTQELQREPRVTAECHALAEGKLLTMGKA